MKQIKCSIVQVYYYCSHVFTLRVGCIFPEYRQQKYFACLTRESEGKIWLKLSSIEHIFISLNRTQCFRYRIKWWIISNEILKIKPQIEENIKQILFIEHIFFLIAYNYWNISNEILEGSNNYFYRTHFFRYRIKLFKIIEWNHFLIKYIFKLVIEFCYQRPAIENIWRHNNLLVKDIISHIY